MRILLGVSGGVAAYKAAELVRALQNGGAEVQVAMTRSARRFVTPLTFAALTGREVLTSLWEPSGEASGSTAGDFAIEHIAAGQGIDALAIAPATASLLARLAHGLANDFVSTLYLATTAPVVLAPAMNVNMWQHPATQANVRLLEGRGARIVAPDAGYLACGMTGAGRLAPVEAICAAVLQAARPVRQDLAGETVLITAGGTREPLDPVRFLGNRSSGRMGYALAEAAIARGARVLLVTSAALPAPRNCREIRVGTAAEMASAVLDHLPEATIVIGAAAVADFRPRSVSAGKLRRRAGLRLELEPTEDIMAAVAAHRRPGTLAVAFAAETEPDSAALEAAGREKLLRKGVDAIVANDVSAEGRGFDADRNGGLFLTPGATVALPQGTKRAMAELIFDLIFERVSDRSLERVSDQRSDRTSALRSRLAASSAESVATATPALIP